ncbi:glycogen debranching N-terminal domain-containing protein [Methylocapsa palsarum]|uniref:Glycogen debranching enzyme (Alpha-1,6-glucosidase) n=1 Tax=Methylocapsa palsarum TaxID=1612308 RepID=A0A1I4D899_9HYPH|nr:glycogen debranching N-terminal domain-containing protein [Methylocapsa palsarum]SFK89742.1 Glycogen debranching enzyme (alpha-1,6-glucosidase) [Methylocapsa palsarum]
MPFKVQIGPPQISIHQGQTVLISDPDGQIHWPSERGLYFLDTRVISSWTVYANGEPWELLNGGPVAYYASRIFLTNRLLATESGVIAPRTLGFTISRWIHRGMHEDLDITNNSMKSVKFQLEIAIRCDFADLFEVKAGNIVRRGRIATEWTPARQQLCTTYRNKDFSRAVTISAQRIPKEAVYANGRLSFEIALDPGEAWHTCLLYTLTDAGEHSAPPRECAEHHPRSNHAETLADWLRTVARIETSNEEFYRLFRRALEDMAALRLPIEGTDHTVFLPAAGLPWFIAPFGRDSLIVSLQNILIYPEFARGSLNFLGAFQAKGDDPYRDAEPGKIFHELRYGELAHFKLIPHTPYYGSADATPLYLITLHAAWRATGDRSLLERHLQTAEGCLSWIDHYGDRDGDGFQEYQTRSPAGYENMAWKDSGDSVVYPDGSLVKGPKALCELQGYVYSAWLRMAEVFDAVGKGDRAEELRAKASALFERFNAAFWDDELGFYAYALDGDKKKVLTIASNAGHCLWCGIVPRERARLVVERLMAPDMWTGWGIRTLSADHPAFNPYNYQTGSVWPHDNGLIALGFKLYGFSAEAACIAHDISIGGSYFQLSQLPELYTAFQRDGTTFPVQYIGANVPQAWAAGSIFMLTQAMLGFLPDAPRNKLYVDPSLPEWLPDITIRDLLVAQQRFDIRFLRVGDETEFEVLAGDAKLVERCEIGLKATQLRTHATR